MKMTKEDRVDNIENAQYKIEEAIELIREAVSGTTESDRVRRTLIAALEMAMNNNSEWLSSQPNNCEELIEFFENEYDDIDEDDDDELDELIEDESNFDDTDEDDGLVFFSTTYTPEQKARIRFRYALNNAKYRPELLKPVAATLVVEKAEAVKADRLEVIRHFVSIDIVPSDSELLDYMFGDAVPEPSNSRDEYLYGLRDDIVDAIIDTKSDDSKEIGMRAFIKLGSATVVVKEDREDMDDDVTLI